jgi:beta-galactosidase
MKAMHKEIILESWRFTRGDRPDRTVSVTLPHSYNAHDGQDGGADYWRGEASYETDLAITPRAGRRYLLRVGAAAYKATVYLNGAELARHIGGYSSFHADLTDALREGENTLRITLSNEASDDYYPALADFTFYGGLTRGVRLLELGETHFDVTCRGDAGLLVRSDLSGQDVTLTAEARVKNPLPADRIRYTLTDRAGNPVAEAWREASDPSLTLRLSGVRPWQGVEDPYLYTVRAELVRHNEVLDETSVRHGFRRIALDPERGFLLNGKETPLRGVSRHQDRLGLGSALCRPEQIEDARLIREIGANTVRLAHYQHSPEFYDYCDEYGFIVWAEIPFISRMLEGEAARENARAQLRELIDQNINHASICFWGISNEITIGGTPPSLISQLRELNDLAHSLDPSRLTTMAQVSPLPIEDEQNSITDAVAYNHYFGWYGGELADNEAWLDRFHAAHPDRPIGLSEYGCEGILTYHSDEPRAGDYSEEYQALYHEHMLRVISERRWIWGSYVWNMFDFGCDARDEGGVKGRNNKGLVTFDRRIKKDAYYLYQAHWTKEPMVHLCGRRYAKRVGERVTLKVYSNAPAVTLSVNGKNIIERAAEGGNGRIFLFEDVPLEPGMNTVAAATEEAKDTVFFERVDSVPESYALPESESAPAVSNWFAERAGEDAPPLSFRDGYYSIRDTVDELLESDAAGDVLLGALSSMTGMRLARPMLRMLGGQTVESLLSSPMAKGRLSEADAQALLAHLNHALGEIKKS